MKLKAILTVLVILSVNFTAHISLAQEYETAIWVSQGDTYLGLFGTDWMKVYQANNDISFSGSKGSSGSPDKIVVGQRLIIPTNTHLTIMAKERLSKYGDLRHAAERAIQKTVSFKQKLTQINSKTYREAVALLHKAENAANGKTYGFNNYIDARRLAKESGRLFTIAQETLQIRRLKQTFAATVTILVLSVVWFLRYSRIKVRAKHIELWINGHQEKIALLKEPGISLYMSLKANKNQLNK